MNSYQLKVEHLDCFPGRLQGDWVEGMRVSGEQAALPGPGPAGRGVGGGNFAPVGSPSLGGGTVIFLNNIANETP